MKHAMKPAHPGAILREDILKEINISVTKAAEALKISRKHLSEVVNETARITAEMAIRLERGFGVEAQFWLDLQSRYDLWEVQNSGRITHIQRISPRQSI